MSHSRTGHLVRQRLTRATLVLVAGFLASCFPYPRFGPAALVHAASAGLSALSRDAAVRQSRIAQPSRMTGRHATGYQRNDSASSDGGGQAAVPASKVLLIGVDGATWSVIHPMILRGRMKATAALVENGAYGNLLSMPQYNSPSLWNSIVTGFGPEVHGITDFVQPDPQSGELVPVNSTMRRTKAIWNILSDYDTSVGVVGFWATWPAERVRGVMVSDRAAFTRYRASKEFLVGRKLVPFDYSGDRLLTYPEEYLEEIRPLLRDPSEMTLDEARQIFGDNPRAAQQLVDAQWEGGFNFKTQSLPQIKFQYMTDKSYGRVCEKILLDRRPEFAAVYFAGPDVLCHLYGSRLLELYAAPEELQDSFLDAILNYYDFIDGAIGRLLKVAGEDYTVVVVSDHGFAAELKTTERSDSSRVWVGRKGYLAKRVYVSASHHKDGVILLSGPGIRKGHIIRGATVLDVLPTLAVLCGIPLSGQLPGRPLLDAIAFDYLDSHPVGEIESYGDRSIEPIGIKSPEDEKILERLRSLGYIE
jgi:hypothetical protein